MKSVYIRSFSAPYFLALGLNTERYSVSLHIHSECGKILTRKTPYMDTFHAVKLKPDFIVGSYLLGQFTGEINVGWRHDCRLLIPNREGSIIIANETDINNPSTIYPINIIDSVQRKKIGDIKLETALYLRAGIYAFTENSEYFIFQSPVSTLFNELSVSLVLHHTA